MPYKTLSEYIDDLYYYVIFSDIKLALRCFLDAGSAPDPQTFGTICKKLVCNEPLWQSSK